VRFALAVEKQATLPAEIEVKERIEIAGGKKDNISSWVMLYIRFPANSGARST
jgi:hypothetical protein